MPPRHVTYLPVLDSLRGIAVLLVLWAHVNPLLPGYPTWLAQLRFVNDPGIQGVDLFFVLSGFLITRILLDERQRGLPLRWFLLRRFLRIFPIYYLLLAIVAVARGGAELPWCAAYLSNFWFSGFQPGGFWSGSFFSVGHRGGPLEHTWSLCIEEHFYLLWPPAVALLGALWSRRLLCFVVLPGAVLTAALVAIAAAPKPVAELLYVQLHYLSPIRFLSLGTGCLLAFGEQRIAAAPQRWLRVGIGSLLAGVLTSSVAWIGLPVLRGEAPPFDPNWWPLCNLVSAWLLSTGLVLVCLGGHRLLPALPGSALLRGVGRISYGLYLYHLPIFHALGMHRQPTGSTLLLALLSTFAAATLSYWLIERPILRFAARYR